MSRTYIRGQTRRSYSHVSSTLPQSTCDAFLPIPSYLANKTMPPRKKSGTEDAPAATEPERRSTRIREAPPKPAPVDPAAKPAKKVKKADPALEEYRPSGAKKAANKKRKKADVEKEDADAEDAGDGAADEESKPKKKVSICHLHVDERRCLGLCWPLGVQPAVSLC
jgi:hypothetical protein